VTAAREAVGSGGGTATGADKRPRGRGGVLVVCFEGRTEEGKNGAWRRRAAPLVNGATGSRGKGGSEVGVRMGQEKKGEGGWHGGGQLGRPATAPAGAVAARTEEPGADRWATAIVPGGGTG
jgi:hypothetical protein